MDSDAQFIDHSVRMTPPSRASAKRPGAAASQSTRTVPVRHRLGLHARPAADFVRLANTFTSEIHLKKGRRVANGKSIMGILTLAAAAGTRVTVVAAGADADEAVRVLSEFLLSGDEESLTKR